jgi:hypothetical protein
MISVKEIKDSVTSTEIFPHEAAGPQFYFVFVFLKTRHLNLE